MELVIFHYHLLPGGVTGVIEQMSEAVVAHSRRIDRVRVVTSAPPEQIRVPDGVSIDVMPTIGYISRQRLADYAPRAAGARTEGKEASSDTHSSQDAAGPDSPPGPVGQVTAAAIEDGSAELARVIRSELLRRFAGSHRIWWIHNHHLGKNPAFTRAVTEIAEAETTQPVVFHIHDFPECGRYANLRFLHAAGVRNFYPQRGTVHYATINSRDRAILEEAGVGPVTYLPNPVRAPVDRPAQSAASADPEKHPAQPEGAPERTAARTTAHSADATHKTARVRQRLVDSYTVEFPRFSPDDRLFLYPVRSIRRKNIFEAALVTMIQDEAASLVVTLPGVSQPEKKYSAMVENAFRDGTIPGMFGIGATIEEHGVSFEQLQSTADVIVSSSIQEGFGYQYIAPLLLGKPLVARQLDIMDDVVGLYADHPHAFYSRITIPATTPSLSGPAGLLRFRYEERVDRLAETLPPEVIEALHSSISSLLSGDTLEFSYLMPHMQYVVLQDLRKDDGFLHTVRALNPGLADVGRRLTTDSADRTPVESVESSFGFRHHASVIDSIIDSLNDAGAPPRSGNAHSDAAASPEDTIVRRFATLEYQRLLYE